jgi:choline dehydrogenase-like flavoprotein
VAIPLTAAAAAEQGPLARAVLAAEPGAEAALLTRYADGRRASVNDVYLEPARSRGNLEVRGDTLVRCVLVDRGVTCGVRLDGGVEVEAPAVVVCAGAIHSPAVLLRSAIDRPGIGRNLQDHPSFPIIVRLREGYHVSPHSLVVSALLRATYSETNDLQVLVMDEADPAAPDLGVLLGALMRVRSQGTVRLADDAAEAARSQPVIDFAMLSDERDLPGIRAAVRLAERVAADPAVARVASVLPYDASDAGVRAALGDYVHAAGTCRMGAADDPMAVVDPSCRVIGVKGLWVCDASVMPRVPRANTHLPTVMIAERVAARLSCELSGR